MIKKIIPIKYDLGNINIFEIVHNVLGNVPVRFGSDRLLIIDANPTTEQLQQIKADFLAAVEEVSDL